jgi:hypothetical protein
MVKFVTVGAGMLFAAAAAMALGWSMRSGQFENFQQGSQSIFGPDEPVGAGTDAFPGEMEN